jgi:hypothetical protein
MSPVRWRTSGGRPAVLPHDGPEERLAAAAVEGHQGLALIGDADGGHGVAGLGQPGTHLGQGGHDGLPDLGGIVLDPPRSGEVLGQLPVGDVDDLGPLVDHEGPDTGGAGIDGHQIAHGWDVTKRRIGVSGGQFRVRPRKPSRAARDQE